MFILISLLSERLSDMNVDIGSIDVIFEYFLRTQSIVSNVFCSSQRTIKLYYKFYNTCRAKKSQG